MPLTVGRQQFCTTARRRIELVHCQPDPEATTFEHMSEVTAGVRQNRVAGRRMSTAADEPTTPLPHCCDAVGRGTRQQDVGARGHSSSVLSGPLRDTRWPR
jgi:hypothetical protein